MHLTNHWNEANTTALIQGISGVAGNIINKQKSGGSISGNDAQIAYLAQQTAAALAQAQQPNPVQSNNTLLYIGGGLALLLIVFIMYKNR
jgi:hypothetical protein